MSIFPSDLPRFAPRRFPGLEVRGRLILGEMQGGKEFEVMEPIVVSWLDDDGTTAYIVVPRGFITDLASIPQFAQSLIGKLGKHNVPSVVHDYLYSTKDRRGKEFADDMFLALMRLKGVWAWRRTIMYQAVAMYGQGEWDDDD